MHAFVRIAYIDGHLDAQFASHAEHFRRYTYARSDYEVNGFSGGAAFSLVGSLDRGWKVVLDGVIVRGGNGYIYVVDSDYLLRALSEFR